MIVAGGYNNIWQESRCSENKEHVLDDLTTLIAIISMTSEYWVQSWLRTPGLSQDIRHHTNSLSSQISISDTWPHVKWAVGLVIAYCYFSLPQRLNVWVCIDWHTYSSSHRWPLDHFSSHISERAHGMWHSVWVEEKDVPIGSSTTSKYYTPKIRSDWGSNSWPPDNDSTFHVTETPNHSRTQLKLWYTCMYDVSIILVFSRPLPALVLWHTH